MVLTSPYTHSSGDSRSPWTVRAVAVTGSEVFTLSDAKVWLRVRHDDEDDLIGELVGLALQRVEDALNHATIQRRYELVFPRGVSQYAVELPRPPLVVLESVETWDELTDSWVVVDASEYVVREEGPVAVVVPVNGGAWNGDIHRFTYTAGYADKASLHPDVLGAIRASVAHEYEWRGDAEAPSLNLRDRFRGAWIPWL